MLKCEDYKKKLITVPQISKIDCGMVSALPAGSETLLFVGGDVAKTFSVLLQSRFLFLMFVSPLFIRGSASVRT